MHREPGTDQAQMTVRTYTVGAASVTSDRGERQENKAFMRTPSRVSSPC